MNIAEEFAEHLVDLIRHDAQPGEIGSTIIRFLACRTDRGAGSYPLGPLLAQLEDELLRIASRLRAVPGSGYDMRLEVSDHAPDRIARKAADLRWVIREEAKKLTPTSGLYEYISGRRNNFAMSNRSSEGAEAQGSGRHSAKEGREAHPV